MAKKHQKAAAAHARANRHKPKPSSPLTELIPAEIITELSLAGSSIDGFGNLTTDIDIDVIDVDWESDCGYEGGVNLTSQSKNLSFKRPLKLQGTCASSCQNSIVSSTPLNTSGAWWKNIFVTIATTLLMG